MSETPAEKFNDTLTPLFHLWSSIRVSGMALNIVRQWFNLGIRVQLLDIPPTNPEIQTPDPRFLHYVIDYPLDRFSHVIGQLTGSASFTLEKSTGGDAIAEILLQPTLTTPAQTASRISWYGPLKREPGAPFSRVCTMRGWVFLFSLR